ncbi:MULTISPECIES: S1 family peptidase [Sphingobium]|uniref:S1 family peptidase n=1 Tax=Sphingobium TaxID=165695 RepID=UPI0015EB38C2|nr:MULTISPECIES: serine protease [Sphingobium]MCW2363867.1 hypothetical protein [Sphingobium sp. B10D3B]MCW2402736.1 hypothetical protein [Sphingobium sp. B10D7B]MCW2409715.1 hypothetical protein [Sphingobium xanthum]
MTTVYASEIENDLMKYAILAQRWFGLRHSDPTAFEDRLRAGLNFGGGDGYADKKIDFARNLSFFSLELFQAMICGGEAYRPAYVTILWQRLVSSGIVIPAWGALKGSPLADHQIDEKQLIGHLVDRTFLNLLLPPARLLDRYQSAVAAVDVLKGDDPFRGTGFLVRHNGRSVFVTCKHNVDPAEGIEIKSVETAAGDRLKLGAMRVSKQYDIAVAHLLGDSHGPHFALSDRVEVFDEVFTLGYPYVPRAEPVLLGHRGEMNARTNLYAEKCPALIISNLVSPGGSGGPVLSRDGHCIGMTINWLEGQWGTPNSLEKMRFSAALPSELIREAIETQ